MRLAVELADAENVLDGEFCCYMYFQFSQFGTNPPPPPSQETSMYMYMHVLIHVAIYVCLSGLWLGGLLYLSFLSDFLKLVCYAHVFPCMYNMCNKYMHMYVQYVHVYNTTCTCTCMYNI